MTIPVQSSPYFSVSGATSLSALPVGAAVHIIGVGGVAMAQLAVALSERGYQVTGSDKQLYEPMRSFLAASTVKVVDHYDEKNITGNLELVVIGNVVSYGHPEVMAVERLALPYTLFPKCLHELIIQDRHSIVVSGTHGKSTTTGLLAAALSSLDAKPSYFVGAALQGFDRSLCAGTGRVSVVEGDEYDSAFFAKVPKFAFYQPQSLIVTAIEFDHADIYSSLEQIEMQFSSLIASMKVDDLVVCCIDDPGVKKLLPHWRAQKGAPRFISYGMDEAAEVQLAGNRDFQGYQEISVFDRRTNETYALHSQLSGLHNARNVVAAAIVLGNLGYSRNQIVAAIKGYRGAKRRQEVRMESEEVIVIDDFAHHPTAVRETIAAIRQRYPNRRIRAVFEPRSNTSRKKIFQNDYVQAFSKADEVLLSYVVPSMHDTANDLLDVRELGRAIERSGRAVQVKQDASSIAEYLVGSLRPGDLMLVMSNGSFGGLVQMLIEQLPHATQKPSQP